MYVNHNVVVYMRVSLYIVASRCEKGVAAMLPNLHRFIHPYLHIPNSSMHADLPQANVGFWERCETQTIGAVRPIYLTYLFTEDDGGGNTSHPGKDQDEESRKDVVCCRIYRLDSASAYDTKEGVVQPSIAPSLRRLYPLSLPPAQVQETAPHIEKGAHVDTGTTKPAENKKAGDAAAVEEWPSLDGGMQGTHLAAASSAGGKGRGKKEGKSEGKRGNEKPSGAKRGVLVGLEYEGAGRRAILNPGYAVREPGDAEGTLKLGLAEMAGMIPPSDGVNTAVEGRLARVWVVTPSEKEGRCAIRPRVQVNHASHATGGAVWSAHTQVCMYLHVYLCVKHAIGDTVWNSKICRCGLCFCMFFFASVHVCEEHA